MSSVKRSNKIRFTEVTKTAQVTELITCTKLKDVKDKVVQITSIPFMRKAAKELIFYPHLLNIR